MRLPRAVALIVAALAMPATAQVTSRVSVDSNGMQGNGDSGSGVSITADGRYVAFASAATNLLPGHPTGHRQVFVHDRQTGPTEIVSVNSGGVPANNGCDYPITITTDGRFVAFTSLGTNLVAGDTNGAWDVFVRDRQLGTTERVSVDSGGVQGNSDSGLLGVSISADGRYVIFDSNATNLVHGDRNGGSDVFVHDRQAGTTERVSVDSGGAEGNGSSHCLQTSISADGRYVAFESNATNLVPGDSNATWDVFVHDRQVGTTERVSVDSGGAQGNDLSYGASLSTDGRYVAFASLATNLVPGDSNGTWDVFVHDRQLGTTERVSVDSVGVQGNNGSGEDYSGSSISADGRYVAFGSVADNLVPGDTNGFTDVFVHDRLLGTTERVSVDSDGTQGNINSGTNDLSISADGRCVAFDSFATNLVQGDMNGHQDVFVHDRAYSPLTSLCDPGNGGVIACPCGNPASGAGRGCDNSSGTGGAILSASGIAYLSQDTLVFTTSSEKPTATSILLQGTTLVSSGASYGQGVRCLGGTLKRLFTKSALGGSIVAPDFGSGDPTVSARSAAKGSPISPGDGRWYLVFYRDPIVLGGCPTSSSFNCTQTGRVDWIP